MIDRFEETTMHARTRTVALALCSLLGGSALAQEPPPQQPLAPEPAQAPAPPPAPAAEPPAAEVQKAAPASFQPGSLLVGARIGVLLPQAFNRLETNFLLDAEVAYQLPFWGKRIGLFFDFSYSQPTVNGTVNDPRLTTNMGNETYKLTLRDVGFTLGVQALFPVGQWVIPYVGVGAKLHLNRSHLEQTAGATDLGTNEEDSTRFGVVGRLGLGLHLGPGMAVFEFHIEYASINHLITDDHNIANMALQLGYVLSFL
jgi:hypothetical protein